VAFVVVQRLDPTHPSALAAIPQETTVVPVVAVTDDAAVRPGHVYVLAAGRSLGVVGNRLVAAVPDALRTLRHSVDTFFRSLVEPRRDNAVVVALSSMGFGGVADARAVKDAAKLVLGQDPRTAREPSMPRAVIDADLAEQVAAPAHLAPRALSLAGRSPRGAVDAALAEDDEHGVPACSTGEEADSLAMAFREAVTRARPPGRFTLQKPPLSKTPTRRCRRSTPAGWCCWPRTTTSAASSGAGCWRARGWWSTPSPTAARRSGARRPSTLRWWCSTRRRRPSTGPPWPARCPGA